MQPTYCVWSQQEIYQYFSCWIAYLDIKNGKEDILVVQTYLVDWEVPFLCGKQTLEAWNFKIDGTNKILEIKTRAD